MKTIFLIIRYLFPRKKWQEVERVNIFEKPDSKKPCEILIVMRDQFGNIKTKRIKS